MAVDRRPRAWRLSGAVTMSIHKLTAGSGYDYLTRQVAALDATAKGHVGLSSYYMERGESPGYGSALACSALTAWRPGTPVTGEQMRALFGAGCIRWRHNGWSSSATLI